MDYFLLRFRFLIPIFFVVISVSGQTNNPETNDSTKNTPIYIRNITLTGNKVTKDKIINRELLLKENDSIGENNLQERIDRSHQNLMNTSLFNFVTFETSKIPDSDSIDVQVEFIERWYIWPVPLFEFADRNLSEWLRKKDWSRLNYGFNLTWDNFRGRREKLLVYALFGFDEKYRLNYQIPFVNKKQTLGLGFGVGYNRNHEISYNSNDNKEIYYKTEDYYAKKEFYAQTEIYYRKSIHNKHWGKISYADSKVHDSVIILNPDYYYGTPPENKFFTLFYQFRSDFRDYQAYPLTGYYFDIEFEKKGIGIFKDPTVNSFHLRSNIRKYINLKGRFYYATGLTIKSAPFWHQPYYYLQGLGYGRDYVRGYEFYVVDGQHYGIWKNNIKFAIIPTRVLKFNFIKSEKFNTLPIAFYLNAHFDVGYSVDDRTDVPATLIPNSEGKMMPFTNPLANRILNGYGVGIDFVSYYDFVFRLEYSVNHRGEGGFFISLLPPI